MTSTTQSTATTMSDSHLFDAAGDLISAMYFEIVVFLITMALAVSMKGLNRTKKAVPKWKLAEFNNGHSSGQPAGANRDRPRPAPGSQKSPKDASAQPQSQLPSKGSAAKVSELSGSSLRPGGSSRRIQELCEDLPRCVDLVCEIGSLRDRQDQVVPKSNSGSPGLALDIFEELNRTGAMNQLKQMPKTSKNNDAAAFFTAVFQCAIRVRKPQLGLDVVGAMRRIEVARSRMFYESAMKILAGKKYYQEALEMYNHMEQDKLEPSAVTMSCLVSFAVEVGDTDKAIVFFEKLQHAGTPSIRAYMTILRVFAKRLDIERSKEILLGMEEKGVKPDNLIVNIVLGTCVSAGKAANAEALLEECLRRDQATVDVISYNTVVKGYAQAGEFAKAIAILEKMSSRIPPVTPNLITFNTIMDAAVRAKRVDEAWKVLAKMRKQGLVPDKYSCSILVKGLHAGDQGGSRQQIVNSLALVAELGEPDSSNLHHVLFSSLLEASQALNDWELMLKVFEQMKAQKVPPQGNTFVSMMKCLSKASRTRELCNVWEEMLIRGIEPTAVSLSILLEGLIIACGEPDLGEKVFDRLPSSHKTNVLLNIMVRVLCKAKETERALARYDEMKKRSGKGVAAPPGLGGQAPSSAPGTAGPEGATYIALIKALSEAGGKQSLEAAMSVLADMLCVGVAADEGIYHALLNACHRDGGTCDADSAKRIFDDMVARRVRPTPGTFSILIKIFGRAKQLDEAFEAMDRMRSEFGLEPSMLTYTCLMQACVRNRQTTKALELFEKLREARLAPDQVTYGTLINGCAYANFISQGVELLEQAKRDGVEVQPDALNNLLSAALRKRTVEGNAQVNQRLFELLKKSELTLPPKIKERLSELQEGSTSA